MTTAFPTALDNFTNPTASDTLNSATVPHATQHANANDAIEALEAKVGINGSADVNSLDYRVNALESGGGATTYDYLTLDTTAGVPDRETGRMYWDDAAKTVSVYLEGPDVTLQVGQEQHIRARNTTGSTILNGKVVYVSGGTGNKPTIALAKADAHATAEHAIGVATEDIENNTDGYVTTNGIVNNVDTSAFIDGDILYLSPSTAGGLTTTRPTGLNYAIRVGYVLNAHITQGSILVHVESMSDIGRTAMTGIPADSSGNYLTNLTYNETTRTVSIAPSSGSTFDIFIAGVRYTFTGTQSIAHGDTQGGNFIYFDQTATLVVATSPWDILLHVPVAYVFWDATNNRGICLDERHHAGRDLYWHRNQHYAEGTKATSGFAITGYTLNDGTTDAATTYTVASGVVEDEDIRITTAALPDNGPYTILERVGVSGDWQIVRTPVRPYLDSGTALQYNQNNGGTWQRTALTEDNFVNYYILGATSIPVADYTPSPTTTQQIVIVPGQAIYTTEAAAHAESIGNLSWGNIPLSEVVPLYQVTMRYNATAPAAFSNTAKCAITRVARIIGTNATITQTAQTDHGALAGLTDDDHTQYDMANPLAASVTYNASGTTTVTLDGGRTQVFYATAATGSTTWAFSNPTTSGKVSDFTLELTNGGSQTQTWPAAVKWDSGTAPTLTAAGVDILYFYTRDAGTTWRGFLSAKDSK